MTTYKFPWIFCGRKVAQPLHALEIRALDLLGRGLRHLRCSGPVEFAGEEIDRALLHVDGGDAVAGVEAP